MGIKDRANLAQENFYTEWNALSDVQKKTFIVLMTIFAVVTVGYFFAIGGPKDALLAVMAIGFIYICLVSVCL